MVMRTTINWGVFGFFGFMILAFFVAGFLVPEGSETDDGLPLNYFLWGMGGMFLLSTGGVVVWAQLSNRRRQRIEREWLEATATILEMGETGTYINNQPRIRFLLHVESPMHPPRDLVHKQVVPLTMLSQYHQGDTIRIKLNPEDPDEVMLG
jgi:hypothetical protein